MESNLITLKYISVCQACKENFNSGINVPYLMKCKHFFCKECIINHFTDENEHIICPDDGPVGTNFNDLILLNNLILEDKDSEGSAYRDTVKLFY
jgi:hypothetical protein